MKQEYINAATQELSTVLFTDHTPRLVILGFISAANFNGSSRTSPFNFMNFGIQSIYISANGYNYPNVPYYLTWTNGIGYVRAFRDMQASCGWHRYTSGSNGLSIRHFASGWTIFAFTLTTSQEDNKGAMDLLRSGTTSLHVRFSTPVPAGGIYLISQSISDGLILVDRNRAVTSDLTA